MLVNSCSLSVFSPTLSSQREMPLMIFCKQGPSSDPLLVQLIWYEWQAAVQSDKHKPAKHWGLGSLLLDGSGPVAQQPCSRQSVIVLPRSVGVE